MLSFQCSPLFLHGHMPILSQKGWVKNQRAELLCHGPVWGLLELRVVGAGERALAMPVHTRVHYYKPA